MYLQDMICFCFHDMYNQSPPVFIASWLDCALLSVQYPSAYSMMALPRHVSAGRECLCEKCDVANKKLNEWMERELGMQVDDEAGRKYQELFWYSRGIAFDQQMSDDEKEKWEMNAKAKKDKAKQAKMEAKAKAEKDKAKQAKKARRKDRKTRRGLKFLDAKIHMDACQSHMEKAMDEFQACVHGSDSSSSA